MILNIITILLCYAPISLYLRYLANIKINNRQTVWTVKNNNQMLKKLRAKSPILYSIKITEILLVYFFVFTIFFYYVNILL